MQLCEDLSICDRIISARKRTEKKNLQLCEDLSIRDRIASAKAALAAVQKPEYVEFLKGSLGIPVAQGLTHK
jgi:hypothetical protein